ncbi:LOW QUALITY PROTEIN: hypothetical protein TorRG33x02_050000 [Trema orientale]|uniref:Uncharacterized protein n=1 Tax=Trema orientale TaxID=63057 RepID=A0A2P5FMZ6_TREOI|nr:LOW QUALITY PROTEIN: hypothetical protein TorRG33x02_050000 [Trema orientale]
MPVMCLRCEMEKWSLDGRFYCGFQSLKYASGGTQQGSLIKLNMKMI